MNKLVVLLLILLLTPSIAAAQTGGGATQATVVAFVNVNVIPMDRERVLRNQTVIVRDGWSRQQRISVHGWIYAIDNGFLRDLGISITRPEEASQQYDEAVRKLTLA